MGCSISVTSNQQSGMRRHLEHDLTAQTSLIVSSFNHSDRHPDTGRRKLHAESARTSGR